MLISLPETQRVEPHLRTIWHSLRKACTGPAVRFNTTIAPELRSSAQADLVETVAMINQHCNDRSYTPISYVTIAGKSAFALPTLSTKLVISTTRALMNLCKRANVTTDEVERFLTAIKKRNRRYLPGGTNALHFLDAAAERRIPFKIFSDRYLMFSYGSDTAIFNSSLTDQESVIAVQLAKSKTDTNRLLRLSGFPVAHQAVVRKTADLAKFTTAHGFPVILKPQHEEQGRGVHTFINDARELTQIHRQLSADYKDLIIENHVMGDGYRIYVYDGKVARVRRLQAAHVMGDGQNTIETLIATENATPQRNSAASSMKPIVKDAVMDELLVKQGVDLHTIPKTGQRIVLSPTSNLSRGGSSSDFIEELHPDNAKLCVDVTKTLGLLCSGVDLISDDAAVSWRENNTVVCEVNAQPQIGSSERVDLHNDMVWSAVGTPPKITLNIEHDPRNPESALYDRTRDEINVTVSAKSILLHGAPVQYFDTLTLSPHLPPNALGQLEALLGSVRPAGN